MTLHYRVPAAAVKGAEKVGLRVPSVALCRSPGHVTRRVLLVTCQQCLAKFGSAEYIRAVELNSVCPE